MENSPSVRSSKERRGYLEERLGLRKVFLESSPSTFGGNGKRDSH